LKAEEKLPLLTLFLAGYRAEFGSVQLVKTAQNMITWRQRSIIKCIH